MTVTLLPNVTEGIGLVSINIKEACVVSSIVMKYDSRWYNEPNQDVVVSQQLTLYFVWLQSMYDIIIRKLIYYLHKKVYASWLKSIIIQNI